MLTHERLLEVLSYDPDTGKFIWIKSLSNAAPKLTLAGTLNSQRYWVIRIDGRLYKRGRLAWFYMTGDWPQNEIDHENRQPWDDRWINLRDVSSQLNKQNRDVRYDNSTGLKGVHELPSGRFTAVIKHNYVSIYLGSFDTKEKASAAYQQKASELGFGNERQKEIRLVD